MTMCVIWKSLNGTIHAATDSRLSFGEKKLDHCVKISRVTCLLHEPGDKSNEMKNLVDKRDIAIIFCGGFTNAYLIKESLSEILNKIIIMKEPNDVSFSDIIDIAFSIYKDTSGAIFSALMDARYGCVFYIVGYCPVKNEMQAFKFEYKLNEDNVYDFYKSQLFDETIYEINGSGLRYLESKGDITQLVEDAYHKNKYTPLLDILETVINDDNCVSVGGALQYIKCDKQGLTLYCHMIPEGNHFKHMKAGIDLNVLNESFMPSGLFFETDAITKRK